jgi:hypothetical protein
MRFVSDSLRYTILIHTDLLTSFRIIQTVWILTAMGRYHLISES